MNKMKKISKNKKIYLILTAIALISFIVFASSSAIANNSIIKNSLEKIGEIEIWADTSIFLDAIQNNIRAFLTLDNKTTLSNQEIEFYLNDSMISKEITDETGYAQTNFNLYNTSPGIYSLRAMFQGNSTLYLNPSSIEKQIEITNQNGTREVKVIKTITLDNETIKLTNQSANFSISLISIKTNKISYIQNESIIFSGQAIINGKPINDFVNLEITFNGKLIFSNKINVTNGIYTYPLIANFTEEGRYFAKVFISNLSSETNFFLLKNYSINLDGMICREFEDYVIWTSGFSHSPEGSVKYQNWTIKTNCTQAGGQNCLLQDITLDTRIIYASVSDELTTGNSYIQISNPDKNICDNPENGEYSKFLTQESITNYEFQKRKEFCEKGEECEIKLDKKFTDNFDCYGIKAYASQSMMIDAFKIRYKWCWDQSYGDNFEN